MLWVHIKESYLNSVWSFPLTYSWIYFFGKWNRKFLKGKMSFSGKVKDSGRYIIFLKLKIIFPEEPIMSESIQPSSLYLSKGHAFSLLRKKYPVTQVRMVRQVLIRTTVIGIGTTAVGFYSGFYIGLSSEYSTGQWEFKAKEQVGISGWKITRKNIRCNGEFWLKQPNRILAEDRPGGIRYHLRDGGGQGS